MTQQQAVRSDPSPHRPPSTPRPARRKHLMSAGAPRPQSRYSTDVSTVQKWVLSSLAVITVGHLAAGLVVAALFAPQNRLDARIGLLVIAGAFGVIAVAAALAIHKKNPLSPWLLLGFLPTLVGSYFVFGR
jgi:hypothetical protein